MGALYGHRHQDGSMRVTVLIVDESMTSSLRLVANFFLFLIARNIRRRASTENGSKGDRIQTRYRGFYHSYDLNRIHRCLSRCGERLAPFISQYSGSH